MNDDEKIVIFHDPENTKWEKDEKPVDYRNKTRWTGRELDKHDFPELKWTIPKILPVGLALLAGRPKIGKSWLGLQIGHAVSEGGKVLEENVDQGLVWYLALEDSPRRLKFRREIHRVSASENMIYETEFPRLEEGGLEGIEIEIMKYQYSLVIIDTLSRSFGNADQMDLSKMSVCMSALHKVSHAQETTILLIDHHRKKGMNSFDPVDDVIGSTGKSAPLDTIIGLYRQRKKRESTLHIVGRDLEDQELALDFDPEYCLWRSLGDADDIFEDSVQGAIKTAIVELKEIGELPTTTKISEYVELSKPNVSRALHDLIQCGEVDKANKVGRQQPYKIRRKIP